MYLLQKLKTRRYLLVLLSVMALWRVATPVQAQFVAPRRTINAVEPLTPKERWSFKTNAAGWIMQIPNAAIEYSLSADPYNKFTLLANVRGTWSSTPDIPTYTQFRMVGARLELRNYWHTRGRDPQNKYSGITDKLFSRERFDARTWRGYYMGVYAGYDNMNVKLSRKGYRGGVIQGGLSYGVVRPIYNYANSVLDIEFGINAGVAYLDGDKYERVTNAAGAYEYQYQEKKGVVPCISDISVSLVYRYGQSIKNRNRYNQAKALQRETEKAKQRRIREEQREEHEKLVEEKKAAKAAQKKAEQAAKEELKAQKKAQAEKTSEIQENAGQLAKEAKKQTVEAKKAAASEAKAAKKAAREAEKAAEKAAKENK